MYDGRLLLPQLSFKVGDFVLDSGTGEASWLLKLAEEVPSTVSLFGIDISSRLFPAARAPNMQFYEESITQLPRPWSSKFRLVNQRLLLAATLPVPEL